MGTLSAFIQLTGQKLSGVFELKEKGRDEFRACSVFGNIYLYMYI